MTELMPIAKKGSSLSLAKFFPLALIWATALGGKFPWTTETFTPAFSNVWPSWSTHVTPPPPSDRNQRSTWNLILGPSSASKARQNSAWKINLFIVDFFSHAFYVALKCGSFQMFYLKHESRSSTRRYSPMKKEVGWQWYDGIIR